LKQIFVTKNSFKILFKKLEISEILETSRKNPGSYGAVQKLPKPENPTQISTYYGQKSSDTRQKVQRGLGG
tara:strand:+ start:374 stop:586 length:213 start_codon:yes stop_codon:yes gene_type:complete